MKANWIFMDPKSLQELFGTDDLWALAQTCIDNEELPPVGLVQDLTSPDEVSGWHIGVVDALQESAARANYRAVDSKKKLRAMKTKLLGKLKDK